MLSNRSAPPSMAARKYDLITALGSYALSKDKHLQKLTLRLITLVTARYNWNRDELAVGQREIARLWSVDERTVKREMAKLRGLGWLLVKRQGARGRVTEYGLGIDTILQATQTQWCSVGSDFDLRMRETPAAEKVVALKVKGAVPPPDCKDGTEWDLARAILHREDASVYGSWIAALTRQEKSGGRLILKAPSRFHGAYVQTHLLGRILTACQAADGSVAEVDVLV